jgi:hypothetical protein
MQVSTSLVSLLRHPAAADTVPHRALRDAGSVGSSKGTALSARDTVSGLAGRGAPWAEVRRAGAAEQEQSAGQVVRQRLAALDRMVSHRLDAFAQRHGELDPALAGDVETLKDGFHASLREAYDAFRETGDRRALMHSVREAFSAARSGFQFVAATARAGGEGEPTLVVDPGPGPEGADGASAAEETTGSGAGGGSTTVAGAPGSGVRVDVTPLEEVTVPTTEGTGSPQDALRALLDQLLAQFGDVLGDGEGSSLKVSLYAELQFGGESLGRLLDALG